VCAVCGTIWNSFGELSLCSVWDSLAWVRVSECVLWVEKFGASLEGVIVCFVWRVWSVFVGGILYCVLDTLMCV